MKKRSLGYQKYIKWFKKNQNENDLNRLLWVLGGEVLIILAYFWFGLAWSILAWVFALLLFFTAITGFCVLYRPFGIKKTHNKKTKLKLWQITPLLIVIAFLPIVAGYYSVQITTNKFLRDLDVTDFYLKQTLYDTTVMSRKLLVADYDQWQEQFKRFDNRYRYYHPFVIKYDSQFRVDLNKTAALSDELDYLVKQGNLGQAELELKKIDQIWAEMAQRNQLSVYDFSLIGFKRVTRKLILAATNMNAPSILRLYPLADLKLKGMEINSNAPELGVTRQALEDLLLAAQEGRARDLSRLGAELEAMVPTLNH